jgi:uncharacterized protein (TIGR02118 family)
MVTVSIFYPNTPESRFDLSYYVTQHIPKMEQMLKPMGMQRVIVEQGIGTPMPDVPPPYSIIAHLIFNNMEEMEMGMGHCSETLMADVPNFFNLQPMVQISRQV